jgi:hypothetical protein
MIAELKTIYKEHLFTEEGRQNIKDAVELKKMWKARATTTDFSLTTNGVKLELIPEFLRDRTSCIEITPIGLNNMCHTTSDLFQKRKKNVKKIIGYNITACPCGRLMSMELHAVNKIDDTLYDFTRDFNDEKKKWFIAIDTELTSLQYINLFGNDPISINKNCVCPIKWNNAKKFNKTSDEIEKHIKDVENTMVKETNYGYILCHKEKL